MNNREIESKKNNSSRTIFTICLIFTLLFLSAAYTYLVIDDPITRQVSPGYEEENLAVTFKNIVVKSGSEEAMMAPVIDSENTSLTYKVNLTKPGQYYIFDVDVVNEGNVNAKLKEIVMTKLTPTQSDFLEYVVTYKDGTEVSKNDLLEIGGTKTLTVSLKFKENVEITYSLSEELDLTYKLNYIGE